MRTKLKLVAWISLSIFVAAGDAPVWPVSQERVPATQLIPLTTWHKEFKITAGKDQGRLVPLSSGPHGQDGKTWKIVFGDYAALYLRRDPGGALLMERLDLIKSHNFVVYKPALPVLPADVSAAEPFQRQTLYQMFNADTGKLKRAGRVMHVLKGISPWRFNTPAGVIDGTYIEIEHRMEMEYYSMLDITLRLGCRTDDGPVYGSGQYTVTKLGVFSDTRTGAAALALR
jgi:hypothetical protein